MIVATESCAVCIPIPEIDLRELQARFGKLFDRAAEALFRQGLDHDDVVFDRILRCAHAGGDVEIEAAWLADRDRLLAHIQQCISRAEDQNHLQAAGSMDDTPGVPTDASRSQAGCAEVCTLVELRVVVRREPTSRRAFPIPPAGQVRD